MTLAVSRVTVNGKGGLDENEDTSVMNGGTTPVMAMHTVASPRLTRTNIQDDEGDDDDYAAVNIGQRTTARRARADTTLSSTSSTDSSPAMTFYYGPDSYSSISNNATPALGIDYRQRSIPKTRRASISATSNSASQSLSTAARYSAAQHDQDLESSLAFTDSAYETALAPDSQRRHQSYSAYADDDDDDDDEHDDVLQYEMTQQATTTSLSRTGLGPGGFSSSGTAKHFQALTGEELSWMATSASIVLGLTCVAIILSLIG
ncbi:hypothetical protein ACM66B_006507 [Microbotryomycetes sp. NB124-2]